MERKMTVADGGGGFDPGGVRRDFSILESGLVWLDNAATTQRPDGVLAAMERFYRRQNANPRRSVHRLGNEATQAFESARERVARFIGGAPEEVVFTAGTTAGVSLVVGGLAEEELGEGDEVWVSAAEHHSNWVPWQQAVLRTGATLKVIPLREDGRLELDVLRAGVLRGRTKWVAVTWVSNVLGLENDVAAVAQIARDVGARVLVDGAQGVAHLPVNVGRMGCDFFAFSGHKMYGPMGIGALWGRGELLAEMTPTVFGGEMIARVDDGESVWAEAPWRFEGGTPHVAGAVGLGAAVDWLQGLPEGAHEHEAVLARVAAERLAELPGVKVWGAQEGRLSLVSFSVEGIHPHDVAQVLDDRGVAIRAGHLCAQPLLRRLGVAAVARASFFPGNTLEEVERLVTGVKAAQELLA